MFEGRVNGWMDKWNRTYQSGSYLLYQHDNQKLSLLSIELSFVFQCRGSLANISATE